MKIALISVGNEVLTGDIVNTNSHYLANELVTLGHEVVLQSVIDDSHARVTQVLDFAFSMSDIVITTGGLGPTQDDLTKETCAAYFGLDLEMNEKALTILKKYFAHAKKEMASSNLKQAMFPADSFILENDFGTAPGVILSQKNKHIVLLPGPPREMKPMFSNKFLPWLKQFQNEVALTQFYQVMGIGESDAQLLLAPILTDQNPSLAPYAKLGYVNYKMVARASTQDQAEQLLSPLKKSFRSLLGKHIVSDTQENFENTVMQKIIEKNLSISTAESCTGGLLASTLVNYPGASQAYHGSYICYSNAMKIELGIDPTILSQHGAVSSECALAMVKSLVARTKTNIGIALTGIAGPEGGTAEKPVGLVYLALAFNDNFYVHQLQLSGDRDAIRHRSVIQSLYQLWLLLENNSDLTPEIK